MMLSDSAEDTAQTIQADIDANPVQKVNYEAKGRDITAPFLLFTQNRNEEGVYGENQKK